MFHRQARCRFALVAALLTAASLTVATRADDDVPPGAANRSAALGDADPVSSWVDETVSPPAEEQSAEASADRQVLHRNGERTKAKAGEAKPATAEGVFDTDVFEMAWPMLVVLVVITGCVYAFKRWMPQAGRPGGGDAVKVLARHYLSGKQSLCLVRTGRRVLLVGITPDRINTLSEITDADEVAALVGSAERGRAGSFTKMFGKLTDREIADEVDEAQDEGPTDRRCHRRLSGIQEQLTASTSNLTSTGKNVQDLIERVRSLSTDADSPAGSR